MNDKQKLIEENIKLVYYIVSREYPTFIHDEDIIQSGMVGLCSAAKSWEGNGLFTTYAGKCIRREIQREFINRKLCCKTVSLDAKIGEEGTLNDVIAGEDDVAIIDEAFFNELKKEEQIALNLNGNGYSTEEIANRLGCSTQKVTKLLRTVNIKWRYFNED